MKGNEMMELDPRGSLRTIYDLNLLRGMKISTDGMADELADIETRREFRERHDAEYANDEPVGEITGQIWHDGSLPSIGRAVAMLLQMTHAGIDVIEWRRQ